MGDFHVSFFGKKGENKGGRENNFYFSTNWRQNKEEMYRITYIPLDKQLKDKKAIVVNL